MPRFQTTLKSAKQLQVSQFLLWQWRQVIWLPNEHLDPLEIQVSKLPIPQQKFNLNTS